MERLGRNCQFAAVLRRLGRSEEHTSELQSRPQLVCRLLLEKKNGRSLGGDDTVHCRDESVRAALITGARRQRVRERSERLLVEDLREPDLRAVNAERLLEVWIVRETDVVAREAVADTELRVLLREVAREAELERVRLPVVLARVRVAER